MNLENFVTAAHHRGFSFMVFLDPLGVPFYPVTVFGFGLDFLLKSILRHCALIPLKIVTDCSNGTIAGTSCCTSSNPCGEGEGDCDSDEDCKDGLKCGQGSGHDNNCDNTLVFPADYDCCYDASKG